MKFFLSLIFLVPVFISADSGSPGNDKPMPPKVIYETRFRSDASGWNPAGDCAWSDAARVPGQTGSLRIWRNTEPEADRTTKWTSPVIPAGGKAVKVSFWAADNYLMQQDFSYAAYFTIHACEQNGKIENTLKTVFTEWDNSVKSPYMWGKRTSENLVWKYYECILPAGAEFLCLEFGFRGPLVRGSCYLTDVLVTETDSAAAASGGKNKTVLLLSSPAVGGIFYTNDSFRFDALIQNLPSGHEKEAGLKISVTDFEYNVIAVQEETLPGAVPCADPAFYQSNAAKKRGLTKDNHLVKRFVLNSKEARVPGILYRIRADLVLGSETLASDTIFYAVTDYPFDLKLDPSGSFFWTRGCGMRYYDGNSCAEKTLSDQDITRKTGSVRSCELSLSYNWRELQPVYPGPVLQKKPLDPFPVQTYIPNVEQVHVARFIPEGAQIPVKEKILYAGRKGMELIDYKADAYAEFILEYIRLNRKSIDWVIPGGLERSFSHRLVPLQKQVYREAHKRFPGIQVGFTINFISLADFEKHELYKYADFLNVHMYGAGAGFPFAESVIPYKNYYRDKLKRAAPPFTMTEGALRTPPGYLNYAAGSMRGIWSLLENGFAGIYYYHQRNLHPLADPDTGDALTSDPHSSLYDNYRFLQLADRPILASELCMTPGNRHLRWNETCGGGASLFPTLSTMVYYNLIRDFDRKKFRSSKLLSNCKVFIFDDARRTVCGLAPLPGTPGNPVVVHGNTPYLHRDLFGRTTRIVPVHGKSVIQTSSYPCTLIFEGPAKELSFSVMKSSGFENAAFASGTPFECNLNLDAEFPAPSGAEAFLSGTEKRSFRFGKDLSARVTLSGLKPGTYPVRVFPGDGKTFCGILNGQVTVQHTFEAEMDPSPMPCPGLKIRLRNRGTGVVSGRAVFVNRYLTSRMRPEKMIQPFSVPPGGKTTLFFGIEKSLARPNYNEMAEVEIEPDSLPGFTLREKLHFRASPRTDREIVVDGDLSDWPLEELSPVLLERVRMLDEDKPAPDSMKSPGRFYTVWKDKTLFMAVIVKDATPQSRYQNVNLWMDDNLLFGIYPWRHREGEKFHSGFYRGHLGFHKDGTVGNYREKDVPAGGSVDVSKVRAAIRRVGDGYVYELAFPEGTLYPLVPEAGRGFRLSLTCFDACGAKNVGGFHGVLSFFGGANVNYHMDTNLWYEFIFTK
ncbi:MAG: hypothetical protein BWY31_02275 [Lentisphaerae bacterium ADurb.Bin242]|nr:MAG: hypothetical protein BWY31_02275 [Lentisphaerae bacterium ADurb.Bin242]